MLAPGAIAWAHSTSNDVSTRAVPVAAGGV